MLHAARIRRPVAAGRMLRAAATVPVALAAVVLQAVPALAHITITPDSAQAGSAAVLTFHVPNEEAKAAIVKVDMKIPAQHPIASLLVRPVPGWTISVKTITLPKPVVTDDGKFTQAVSEIIWSGGEIPPGQFQDFSVSADPLPSGVSKLAFKAVQTYSNGDVVRWIDLPQPGQPAPEHPAPLLTLTKAAPIARTTARSFGPGARGPEPDGAARALAAAGLAAGLLGLATGIVGLRRSRVTGG